MPGTSVTSAPAGKKRGRRTGEVGPGGGGGQESRRRGVTGREVAGPEPAGGPGTEAPTVACPPRPRPRRMISRYTRKAVPQSLEL